MNYLSSHNGQGIGVSVGNKLVGHLIMWGIDVCFALCILVSYYLERTAMLLLISLLNSSMNSSNDVSPPCKILLPSNKFLSRRSSSKSYIN